MKHEARSPAGIGRDAGPLAVRVAVPGDDGQAARDLLLRRGAITVLPPLVVKVGNVPPRKYAILTADTTGLNGREGPDRVAIDVVVSDAAGREVIRQKSDGPVGVREMKLDWSGLPVEEYSCAVAARWAGGAEIPVTDGRITVTLKPETFVLVAAVERERVGNHRPPRLGRSVLAVMTYRTDKSHSSDKSYWPDAGNRRVAVLSDAMPLPGVVPGILPGNRPLWVAPGFPASNAAGSLLFGHVTRIIITVVVGNHTSCRPTVESYQQLVACAQALRSRLQSNLQHRP